jgi:glycogen debranching enzyme
VDLVTGQEIRRVSSGMVLAASPPGMSPTIMQRVRGLVIDGELSSEFGVLSSGRNDPAFAPGNYWRGPAWRHLTELVALGLERNGDSATAGLLHDRGVRFVNTAGASEYVHADTGAPLGAQGFTWTAATALWEEARRVAPA